ncbi:hypothetical protein ACFFRR_009564 [Megaselia abdita]
MIFDLTKNVKITLSLTICLANSFVLSISDFDSYINHITKNQSNPTVLYPVQKTSQQKYEERIKIDSFVFAIINYTYSTVDGKEIPNSSEQGRYGEGRVQSAHGVLVHVTMEDNIDDHSACTHAITGTNRSALPSKAWIALVRRGKCTFEDKVQNVWLRGAVGIIVYNDKNSKELEKMQIRDKQRNITAVFTTRHFGENLARLIETSYSEVKCSISEGQRHARQITKTSVLFISVSFIILMCISLIWLMFYYIQRFRYLQSKEIQSRQLCSLTKKVIMKIPIKTGVRNDEKDSDQDCCPICIETYRQTDCIRILPCNHEFHKNCIDPWLVEHRTCPMCKLDVLKFYGYIIGDLTIEHIGTSAPVQFVHLEIPTDSPQLPVRNTSGLQPTSFMSSHSNYLGGYRRNRSSSGSSNCSASAHSIIDNSDNFSSRNTSASQQVTEV